uniref:Apple domain-containing protein n=1 Tax=Rhabditophanes sp. KR3021 TaxID=114890 RepID=A0AC35TLY0_9BILA
MSEYFLIPSTTTLSPVTGGPVTTTTPAAVTTLAPVTTTIPGAVTTLAPVTTGAPATTTLPAVTTNAPGAVTTLPPVTGSSSLPPVTGSSTLPPVTGSPTGIRTKRSILDTIMAIVGNDPTQIFSLLQSVSLVDIAKSVATAYLPPCFDGATGTVQAGIVNALLGDGTISTCMGSDFDLSNFVNVTVNVLGTSYSLSDIVAMIQPLVGMIMPSPTTTTLKPSTSINILTTTKLSTTTMKVSTSLTTIMTTLLATGPTTSMMSTVAPSSTLTYNVKVVDCQAINDFNKPAYLLQLASISNDGTVYACATTLYPPSPTAPMSTSTTTTTTLAPTTTLSTTSTMPPSTTTTPWDGGYYINCTGIPYPDRAAFIQDLQNAVVTHPQLTCMVNYSQFDPFPINGTLFIDCSYQPSSMIGNLLEGATDAFWNVPNVYCLPGQPTPTTTIHPTTVKIDCSIQPSSMIGDVLDGLMAYIWEKNQTYECLPTTLAPTTTTRRPRVITVDCANQSSGILPDAITGFSSSLFGGPDIYVCLTTPRPLATVHKPEVIIVDCSDKNDSFISDMVHGLSNSLFGDGNIYICGTEQATTTPMPYQNILTIVNCGMVNVENQPKYLNDLSAAAGDGRIFGCEGSVTSTIAPLTSTMSSQTTTLSPTHVYVDCTGGDPQAIEKRLNDIEVQNNGQRHFMCVTYKSSTVSASPSTELMNDINSAPGIQGQCSKGFTMMESHAVLSSMTNNKFGGYFEFPTSCAELCLRDYGLLRCVGYGYDFIHRGYCDIYQLKLSTPTTGADQNATVCRRDQ